MMSSMALFLFLAPSCERTVHRSIKNEMFSVKCAQFNLLLARALGPSALECKAQLSNHITRFRLSLFTSNCMVPSSFFGISTFSTARASGSWWWWKHRLITVADEEWQMFLRICWREVWRKDQRKAFILSISQQPVYSEWWSKSE